MTTNPPQIVFNHVVAFEVSKAAIEICRTAALGGHVERCVDLWSHAHRLQLLPQPALPQVSVVGGRTMARGSRGRVAPSPLLPRGVHLADHRVPE